VYYGVGVSMEGTTLNVTWHNYTDADVTPTTMTMYSPYLDASVNLGEVTAKEGQTISINAAKSKTGPYELQIAWNNGAVTALGLYKNGDEIWSCQSAEKSSTYMCYWYDRKDAIDGEGSVTASRLWLLSERGCGNLSYLWKQLHLLLCELRLTVTEECDWKEIAKENEKEK